MNRTVEKNTIYIGIGDYEVSRNHRDILKTCALGSCVAVFIYDKKKHIAGLIHIALPESCVDPVKAVKKPGYYVDTGLPVFIEKMKRFGATRDDIWIKLAGGANTLTTAEHFNIGKRNILAIKRYLWKFSMGPICEDVGGTIGRTVSFFVDTGKILVSSGGEKRWEL